MRDFLVSFFFNLAQNYRSAIFFRQRRNRPRNRFTLLRYKENGSTLELAKRDKVMGVDYYVVDVTDKQNRKTRFYVSAKKFRVMMLEYTEGNVNYRRKFYDYNYAQGTLVPYRTVLWANDKQIEESEVQTISFGQKIDDNLFQGS